MGDRLLGLDLGSSSVRAVTFGADDLGRGAVARRPVQIAADGDVDVDAYTAAVEACLDELHDRGELVGVATVATAAMWHSVVAIDRAGAPLGPARAWVGRPASSSEPDEEGARALHRRTGCRPHDLYWTARIPALRGGSGSVPAGYASLPTLVLAAVGAPLAESRSMASGTGLLDLSRGCWDDEALDRAGVGPAALLPLAGSLDTWPTPPTAASRWPGLAAATWHPIVGDGAASNVGSGAATSDRLAATVGTSAAVRVVHRRGEAPPAPFECWRYVVDDDHVITGAAASAGGNVFRWAADVLRLPLAAGELDAALQKSSAEPSEVVALPHLFGARPGDPPGLRGTFVGLDATTTAVELLRALLDGVGHELRRLGDLVGGLVTSSTPIALGGGAPTASPWWRRRLAGQLGRPVLAVTEREVAALGAVALAAGRRPDPTVAIPPPAPAVAGAFAAAAGRHRTVRDAVASLPAGAP